MAWRKPRQDTKKALLAAINEFGGQRPVSRKLGIPVYAISNALNRGSISESAENEIRAALGLEPLKSRPGKIGIGRVDALLRERKLALGVSWEEVVLAGLEKLEKENARTK